MRTLLLITVVLCTACMFSFNPKTKSYDDRALNTQQHIESDTNRVFLMADGQVINLNNEPIAGMLVETSILHKKVKTDDEGFFIIRIRDDEQLVFQKDSFTTVTINPLEVQTYTGQQLKISFSVSDEVIAATEAPPPPPPSPGAVLKIFPNPYPKPSGIHNLDPDIFSTAQTLADVNKLLIKALEACGYDERRYYYFPPEGFALITKMEQTNKEAFSLNAPHRWSTSINKEINNPIDYITSLLTAPTGYYRIFVFLIADTTTSSSGAAISEAKALQWLENGYASLPVELGRIHNSSNHTYTLLVYQYRKTEHNATQINNISGRENFVRSRLSQFLK